MKIALITPYYDPIVGGITTFVKNLGDELASRGHEIVIISANGQETENVYIVKRENSSYSNKVRSILNDFNPDVIHANAHWYTIPPALSCKKIKKKIKVVFTFHTDISQDMNGIKKILFQRMLSKCDCVTYVSRASQGNIEKILRIKTMSMVVYPGVRIKKPSIDDIENFEMKYNLQSKKPVISIAVPLEWNKKTKGVLLLINAMRTIIRKYPSSVLLIIGDGGCRKEIENEVIHLGLEKNVIITGFVPNIQVPLHITDIYTNISLQESFGLSMLEAMAARKPVIATPVGGIPEIIKDRINGLIVDAESETVAERILSLYNDSELMKFISDNAFATTQSDFSWSFCGDNFMRIYGG